MRSAFGEPPRLGVKKPAEAAAARASMAQTAAADAT